MEGEVPAEAPRGAGEVLAEPQRVAGEVLAEARGHWPGSGLRSSWSAPPGPRTCRRTGPGGREGGKGAEKSIGGSFGSGGFCDKKGMEVKCIFFHPIWKINPDSMP